MCLPEDFILTQGKLEDYRECQRRFQIKYLLNCSWSSMIPKPIQDIELMTILGQRFHLMLRQYFLGIAPERLLQMTKTTELENWMNKFLKLQTLKGEMGFIWQESTRNFAEVKIAGTLKDFQMIATYDLISITAENKFIITDWKTSRNPPNHSELIDKMQTKIYPFLLVEAGSFLDQGKTIEPDDVEIIYWFSNFPDQSYKFSYTVQLHTANLYFLSELIDEINRKQYNDFLLTTQTGKCRFCNFRTLCKREVFMDNLEEPIDFFEEGNVDDKSEFWFEEISETVIH